MRILLPDLTPGTVYNLQLRAKDDNGGSSEWSKVFTITTTSDTVAPKTPTNVVETMSGTTFNLTWDAVVESADNTAAHDLDHYEVLVASSGTATTKIYAVTDTKFQFTLDMNRLVFTSPRANIQMSVRAVDKVGNASAYSAVQSQTNPAPANPTGFTGVAGTDVITFKWNAVADTDLMEYRIYSGTSSTLQSALVWSGSATGAALQSIEYTTDKWFKVAAVDVFGTASVTPPVVGPLRPNSPFLVDTTAPSTPTGLAATLANATDGKSANAAVSWTAVTDTDNDLAEYIIGYKPSAASDWQYVKVDYTLTSTRIDNLLPYTNYDFRIRASDWSANLSGWSTTLTKTAATNSAPAVPTGLAITAGKDDVIVRWTANTEPDMANGAGVYDVTVSTSSTFASGNLQYRTGADNIAVNGLNTNTTYYARVRATDSGGISSAYSTAVNATTSDFPLTALSDGNVPVGAPTVTASAGLGYVYLKWTTVTNTDPVVYDVYMSTTNNFTTYDATTKITEVSGTSAIIDTTVAGASLVYGTTYYFKVRARDRDGSSATISAQASAAPSKAGTSDISTVDASLITSGTSFTTNLFIGSGGAIQSTGYVAGSTGFKLSNTGLVIEGAGNTVSASVLKGGTITGTTINVGVGGVINVDSTASIKSNNYSAGSTGYVLGATGLELNDGSVDAKVLKTNSAIIGDLTMGQSANSLGTIKSFDYVAGSAGWKIGKGLFEINQGVIKAGALQIQSGSNLIPAEYASFDFTPAFYTGKLPTGTTGKTIATSGGKFGAQYLSMRATTAAAFEVYLCATSSDYNVPVESGKTYIISTWAKTGSVATGFYGRVKYSDGTYSSLPYLATLPANGVWQRVSFTVTVPANVTGMIVDFYSATATIGAGFDIDGVQVEEQIGALATPSSWSMPGITSADGGILRTGEIRSTSNTTVNGVSQPAWSINLSGNAQFGDALIRGKLLVGQSGADVDAGQSYIASGNYVANTTGWKLTSAGNLEANSGTFRGQLKVGVTDEAGSIIGTRDYIASRGSTDLITNGTGYMGNNTNFSAYTLDKTDTPLGTSGSFDSSASTQAFVDETLPIDPSRRYLLKVQAKQKAPGVTAYCYLGLQPVDAYGYGISPQFYMYQANTTTTLAADLKPGDTTVYLTSAANWNNAAGTATWYRSFIFWGYTDPGGKTWEERSYSRDWYGSDAYADGAVNTTANTITLNNPWVGMTAAGQSGRATIPAGTKVSNGSSGGNYMYGGLVNTNIPETWTEYSAEYGGIMPYGGALVSMGAATTAFPPGTSAARITFLQNRQGSGVLQTGSKHSFAAISMSDATQIQKYTESWRYPGSTTINGGVIQTQTLTADIIGTGELSAGTRIIAGPENGTHAEVTATGFRVYVEDPVDGIPNEVVRMGVADTNDLFSISDSTGLIRASIADTGFGSFTGINIDGNDDQTGVTVWGEELKDILATYPRGLIAYANSAGDYGPYTGQAGYMLCETTLQGGRMYRIGYRAVFDIGTSTIATHRIYARIAAPGVAVPNPTFSDTQLLQDNVTVTPGGVDQMTYGSTIVRTPTTLEGWGIKILLEGNASTGQYTFRPYGDGGENWLNTASGGDAGDPQAGNMLYIEDIGPSTSDDGSLWNASYNTAGAVVDSGGTQGGNETSTKTYTTTWTSTAAGTYNGSGTKRTDTTDVVQGYNSYNGDGSGLWIFPSMTSTLSGATINKVEVYAYANHWYYNSGGTALIRLHAHTTVPASNPTITSNGINSTGWPKPGGRWVTLPSSLYAGFKSGTYRGFGMAKAGSTNLLYYGRFNGGTGAKIRITYTK